MKFSCAHIKNMMAIPVLWNFSAHLHVCVYILVGTKWPPKITFNFPDKRIFSCCLLRKNTCLLNFLSVIDFFYVDISQLKNLFITKWEFVCLIWHHEKEYNVIYTSFNKYRIMRLNLILVKLWSLLPCQIALKVSKCFLLCLHSSHRDAVTLFVGWCWSVLHTWNSSGFTGQILNFLLSDTIGIMINLSKLVLTNEALLAICTFLFNIL